MQQTLTLFPGVTLRCRKATRFKQGALSLQFLRPMCREEAALNALIPSVLLRGCRDYPDLQRITLRLDDLYGASIGTLVRRIGDYHATGFYCGFIEDRFALRGDAILAPLLELVGKLLLDPCTENGAFLPNFVESEKVNLISTIDSQRSDKRAYASNKLLETMCQGDSFAVPRLGTVEAVRAITPEGAFAHYRKVLEESPVEIYYVGSMEPGQVADLLRPLFAELPRRIRPLPAQTPLVPAPECRTEERMDVAQGRLCLGYLTHVNQYDPRFAAMQLAGCIFGGGMTNRIFNRIREELSLCYEISSSYYGSKGVLTVAAGIDFDKQAAVEQELDTILAQLQAGAATATELDSARQYLLSGLRSVYDSPGAMENYFSTCAILGLDRTPESHAKALEAVTLADLTEAFGSIRKHSSFFLRGYDHA